MSRKRQLPEGRDTEVLAQNRVRLDKWLWAARFFKTRALAAEAIDGGKVDVDGERARRSRSVQVGNEIRVRQGPLEWYLVVRGVADRRGSAQVARLLYDETEDGKRRRELVGEQLRRMPTAFSYGSGKPGKRDRRLLERFRQRNREEN